MHFQGVLMNVADLDRSIAFYREVLGFTLLSQKSQLAAVHAPGSDPPQVIVLRAFGSGRIGGARQSGLRAFIVEVDTAEELKRIAGELESRKALVSRRDQKEWSAVVGRDPDGVAVVIDCVFGDGQIVEESWRRLDDLLYGIGE